MRVTVRSAGIDEAHAVLSIMQVAFEEYRGRLDPPSGAVLPAHRGKGVAGALMTAIGASASAHSVAEVRVGVRGSLPANRRLYEKLGYRVRSSRPYETGTDVDVTLSKELKP